VALVLLCGFAVMGLLAYRTYTAEPPIPDRVVADDGRVLFTGQDVSRGQQVFLHNGLPAETWVGRARRSSPRL
jgi:nitric oxide reductase subunit B